MIKNQRISRRQFLNAITAGFTLSNFSFIGNQRNYTSKLSRNKKTQPNVLLILCDDLGARLSCYDDPVAKTPNIDILAKRGVLFSRSYCQYPTCGPSRVSMLSGLYPFETGWTSNANKFRQKLPDIVTLPQLFRQNNYFTIRIGKIFHMGIPMGIGTPGDDDPKAWDLTVNNTGWDAKPENILKAHKYGTGKNPGVALSWLDPDIKDEEMADGIGTVEALKILKDYHPDKTGKPFFLGVGFYRPHPPMIAPKSHYKAIDLESFTLPNVPESDRDDIPAINFHLRDDGFNFIPEEYGRNYTHAYYAAVHFVDSLIGRLIKGLDQFGLSKNTIIVLAGDQGFHLGEHGHWHKSTFFEEACQVPLIIVDPRIQNSSHICNEIVGLIDVYPTLCDLAGLNTPHKLSGQSLMPQLKNTDVPGKSFELTMGTPGGYSICTDRYRYTEWDNEENDAMFYDLQQDLHEFNNLIDDPQYTEKVRTMKRMLKSFISNR